MSVSLTDKDARIKSPFNYLGGKYKLLTQILPLFPKDIDVFVDLFCGGCDVGINVDCDIVIFNDLDKNIISLCKTFQDLDKEITFDTIDKIIEKYGLSRTSRGGYSLYGCNSSAGLSSYNKEKYLNLRRDLNSRMTKDYYYYIMLYILIVYSFNNQIRFNKSGEFNLPVGKRDFNSKMKNKLSKYIDRLKSGNYSFCCIDFREFRLEQLSVNSFIYVDPPYLVSCATYNEQNGWSEEHEEHLLSFLDRVHSKGIRFALSNVIRSKGKENKLLIKWLTKNSNIYKRINLKYNYSNSNYQTKGKSLKTEEVLIINY